MCPAEDAHLARRVPARLALQTPLAAGQGDAFHAQGNRSSTLWLAAPLLVKESAAELGTMMAGSALRDLRCAQTSPAQACAALGSGSARGTPQRQTWLQRPKGLAKTRASVAWRRFPERVHAATLIARAGAAARLAVAVLNYTPLLPAKPAWRQAVCLLRCMLLWELCSEAFFAIASISALRWLAGTVVCKAPASCRS